MNVNYQNINFLLDFIDQQNTALNRRRFNVKAEMIYDH